MFTLYVQFTSKEPQQERGEYYTEAEALSEAIEYLKDGYIVQVLES
jgi:hypothetical protein